MKIRVHELARELSVSSSTVLSKLADLSVYVKSASSKLENEIADQVRRAFGQPTDIKTTNSSPSRQSSWTAGAVKASTHPDTIYKLKLLKQAFPVASEHHDLLASLGSQFVYSKVRVTGAEECALALVRFSTAIESAFGLTREALFFYSPHRDLQIRTFRAARKALGPRRQARADRGRHAADRLIRGGAGN